MEVSAVTEARSSELVVGGTSARKADHIRINLEEDVSAKGVSNGFEHYRFVHQALPEVDLDRIDLGIDIFNRHLSTPIFVSCMTGGVPQAGAINRTLALVAQ